MKVYVATSWRNDAQPDLVRVLRDAGHQVYDFRRAHAGYEAADGSETGFAWGSIDPEFARWSAARYRESLSDPEVAASFERDMSALRDCDVCLLLQPCGRSAALELGWAVGAGKHTMVLLADQEPELMLKMATHFCLTTDEVLDVLAQLSKRPGSATAASR